MMASFVSLRAGAEEMSSLETLSGVGTCRRTASGSPSIMM